MEKKESSTARKKKNVPTLSTTAQELLSNVFRFINEPKIYAFRNFRFDRSVSVLKCAMRTKKDNLPKSGHGWARDYFNFLTQLHALEMMEPTVGLTGAICRICASGIGVPFGSIKSRCEKDSFILYRPFFEVRKYPEVIQRSWDHSIEYMDDPLDAHRESIKKMLEPEGDIEGKVLSILESTRQHLFKMLSMYFLADGKYPEKNIDEIMTVVERYIAGYFSIIRVRFKMFQDERCFPNDETLMAYEQMHKAGVKLGLITSEDWKLHSMLFKNIWADPDETIVDSVRTIYELLSQRDENNDFVLSFSDIIEMLNKLFESRNGGKKRRDTRSKKRSSKAADKVQQS